MTLIVLAASVVANTLSQGSSTFWAGEPHSVLIRFQRAATISADQKRKVFAKNSGLFPDKLMAKTKKKRWESFRKFIAAYISVKKGKKVAGRMTIKDRSPSKIPRWAASHSWAVGCRPLALSDGQNCSSSTRKAMVLIKPFSKTISACWLLCGNYSTVKNDNKTQPNCIIIISEAEPFLN